jgi:superfamily II DNA/RNA helicase
LASATTQNQSSFADFQFPDAINQALIAMGYETPTPVQTLAIPLVIEGKDVLATAQTGTGKTAAFALPLLKQMLAGANHPALVVAPTRELAEQIGGVLKQLTQFVPQIKSTVIIGGTAYHHQIRSLRANPMFVIGTPGRLLDQIRGGHLNLTCFGTLVIDEADRLLDMGFEPQMNELVAKMPSHRQSLLFSATLPQEIVRLANSYLRNPIRVAVGAVSKPVERIRQSVLQVATKDKDLTLLRELEKSDGSIIIFMKTKYKTERLSKFLAGAGLQVARIHGDRTQRQRSGAISDFREGRVRILVATDIAARGLDIPHIQHVINYDLPMCPEDYIHRIGRTARAGAEGHSLSFVTPEERQKWARIHKFIHGCLPDESMKNARAPNRAERRAPLAQKGRSQGRNNRGAQQFVSPRRTAELRAEQFLKDERREAARGGPKPLTTRISQKNHRA